MTKTILSISKMENVAFNVKGVNATLKEISYLDLFIRKKHKFIRNILTESQLRKSEALKPVSSYYGFITKFVTIFILL